MGGVVRDGGEGFDLVGVGLQEGLHRRPMRNRAAQFAAGLAGRSPPRAVRPGSGLLVTSVDDDW